MRYLIAVTMLLFTPVAASAGDREDVLNAMDAFFAWDMQGGRAHAEKSLAETVKYHRVDKTGQHIAYSVNFDHSGKGLNAYKPYIISVDVYGDMALVRSLNHYDNPKSYVKAYVLHKLVGGWRITNVMWGAITPEK